jgi:hypothetical protein
VHDYGKSPVFFPTGLALEEAVDRGLRGLDILTVCLSRA